MDFDLHGVMDALVDQVSGGLLSALTALAEATILSAEAEWYGPHGVARRTGRSGKFVLQTSFSPSWVRIAIYPVETYAFMVHRRGALSLRPKFFLPGRGRKEWKEAKDIGIPTGREKGGQRRWIVYEPHPHASDGANMWQAYVARPFRVRIGKDLPDELKSKLLITRTARGKSYYTTSKRPK